MSDIPKPAPLVPPEVDLNGYDFMPFYGEFLRTSDFNSRVSDAEYRAAVNLWWSSWLQVPAASLPDDDAQLCKLADLGRDMRRWRKVKHGAMSGFTLCSDGRWYHEFLSIIAKENFKKKISLSARARAGANKRWHNNANANASSIPPSNAPGNASVSRSVITPLPPTEKSTSTPKAAAHSIARTEENKRNLEQAAKTAAPMPEQLRSILKPARPLQPFRDGDEDLPF